MLKTNESENAYLDTLPVLIEVREAVFSQCIRNRDDIGWLVSTTHFRLIPSPIGQGRPVSWVRACIWIVWVQGGIIAAFEGAVRGIKSVEKGVTLQVLEVSIIKQN
jgi:hypothetical protein